MRKASSVSHDKEMIKLFRKDPKFATEYLNSAVQAAFKENEPELVLIALSLVSRAFGMTKLAKRAAVRRESLHRMLHKRGNPEWNSLFRVFRALRLRPRLESAPL